MKMNYLEMKQYFQLAEKEGGVNRIARFFAILSAIDKNAISQSDFLKMYSEISTSYQKARNAVKSLAGSKKTKDKLSAKVQVKVIPAMEKGLTDGYGTMIAKLVKNLADRTFNVTCHGDIFIVPNKASRGAEFFDWTKEHVERLAQENDSSLEDKFVQVWATNPIVKGSNYQRHGITFVTLHGEDKPMSLPITLLMGEYVPSKVFKGISEGDIVKYQETIIVNSNEFNKIDGVDDTESVELKFVINWQLRANQTSYGYSQRGRFEKVLMDVLRDSKDV